jgi:hypothetical protein
MNNEINPNPDLVYVPAKYWRGRDWNVIVNNSENWFSKSAMAFFGSRILWGTLRPIGGDNFTFITSEDRGGVRKYTVREWMNGTVETLGEFWEHETRSAALRAQAKYHKEEEDYVKSFDNK